MKSFFRRLLGKKTAPKNGDAKIKIALDQSVGRWKARALREMGYDIVVVARDAEKDEKWMNKAFAAGALFVISPDLDIPCLIERENYPMIWIDYLFAEKTRGKRDWVDHIDKRIKDKLSFFRHIFGGECKK